MQRAAVRPSTLIPVENPPHLSVMTSHVQTKDSPWVDRVITSAKRTYVSRNASSSSFSDTRGEGAGEGGAVGGGRGGAAKKHGSEEELSTKAGEGNRSRSESDTLARVLRAQLDAMHRAGTYKHERVILSAQGATIFVTEEASIEEVGCPQGQNTAVETANVAMEDGAEEVRGSSPFSPPPPTEMQRPRPIITSTTKAVLNFCSNNYLGMSNHPALVDAAKRALDTHGHGLASVRFICGTQDIHQRLERKIAAFHGKADAILYPSCFDANAGLFEVGP
jgi:hypothetical protein